MKRSVIVGAVVVVSIGIFAFAITQLMADDTPATRTVKSKSKAETEADDESPEADPEADDDEGTPDDLPRAEIEKMRAARPPAPNPTELEEFPPLPEHMAEMDRKFQGELVELMGLSDSKHKTWFKQYEKTQKALDKMYHKAGDDPQALDALKARNQTFQESVASHGAQ